MIEPVEESEIQFSREDDGAAERLAAAKKEESAEVNIFENSISSSSKSGNNSHREELYSYLEIGELETLEVHGSIDAIERCASNGQSRYMLVVAQITYKYNIRIVS